jgi:thiol:disulfide interchange protein DsbD
VVASLIVLAVIAISVLAPRKLAAAPETSSSRASQGGWQPWSAQAVSLAQSAGRPVLVDFTAKWCLSCQVNERAALEQPEVEKALQDSNVLLLKADWTRYDDSITQALKSMGRSGVPAYALYTPGQDQPELLPEVLTPGIVIDAVSKLRR